jgi:hypothetical protein
LALLGVVFSATGSADTQIAFCQEQKKLDSQWKTAMLGAKVEETTMRSEILHTHLKRCSWWWRANPTG